MIEVKDLEKWRVPESLRESVIKAREANQQFQAELERYANKLVKNGMYDKCTVWIEFLKLLADGQNLDFIVDATQGCLGVKKDIQEILKIHGFPEEFFEVLK